MGRVLDFGAWSERTIQRKLIEYAAKRGVKVVPVAARGRRGFPDLLGMYRYGGRTWWFLLELKTLDGELSKNQRVYHKELRPWTEVRTAYGWVEAALFVDQFVKDHTYE